MIPEQERSRLRIKRTKTRLRLNAEEGEKRSKWDYVLALVREVLSKVLPSIDFERETTTFEFEGGAIEQLNPEAREQLRRVANEALEASTREAEIRGLTPGDQPLPAPNRTAEAELRDELEQMAREGYEIELREASSDDDEAPDQI